MPTTQEPSFQHRSASHWAGNSPSVRSRSKTGLFFSSPTTVPRPPTGTSPIIEFSTEGYISGAFSTLFPTGAADFIAPRSCIVTIGNYYKHLMMYKDGRFARHPRFHYFALNTEMRWHALQIGRIYVHQYPHDTHLSVEELRDMVGRPGEAFSSQCSTVLPAYEEQRHSWFRQRSRLIATVDTLGLLTIFFTHSAANLQWLELQRLICPDYVNTHSACNTALQEHPAIANWFRSLSRHTTWAFSVLLTTGCFEWQHHGSSHVHGLARLKDVPDVQRIGDPQEDGAEQILFTTSIGLCLPPT